MDDLYYTPYLQGANTSSAPPRFPYSRKKLMERPIFPTYIFDGGASFFLLDTFGTNDSDKLLNLIVSSELYKYWTIDGRFHWNAVFQKFSRLHYTAEWEAHLWLNRLYVLLPLAQAYCRTKDSFYAQRWYDTLMDWYSANPYTTYEDRPDDMVWRDMQVAWRTINMVHSIFLIGDQTALTESQWNSVYDLIRLHASHMYQEGLGHAERHIADNHHLQIGMALIMLGVLFPAFGHSEEYIETGRQIVSDNLEYSIYADGVNNEDSMTYSHFIARLYLEAELLLTKNGLTGVPNCAEKIQKQYEFLFQFSSPNGSTLPIGDSYWMDALEDIAFVHSIYPLTFPREKKSALFESSRMAVLRNSRFDVYIDAMDMTEWHPHYGRPHFIAFADGQPLVIDSGSINYDRYDLRCQLNGASGHNVLSCEELPLEWELEKTEVTECLHIDAYEESEDVQRLVITNTVSDRSGRSYRWTRDFTLSDQELQILDTVTASEDMHFTLSLHLPDCKVGYYDHACKIGNTDHVKAVQPISGDRKGVYLRHNEKMQSVETTSEVSSTMLPCVTPNNQLGYTQVITRTFYTNAFEEKTVIRY